MINPDTCDRALAAKKMLDAVRTILETSDYLQLSSSNIAAAAGVPRMLLFECFGSVDSLVEQYYSRKNYWSSLLYYLETYEIDRSLVFGQDAVTGFFRLLLGVLENDVDLQQALYWEMNERHRTISKVFSGRDEAAGKLIALSRPVFRGSDAGYIAVYRHCFQYLYRMIVKSYVLTADIDKALFANGPAETAEDFIGRTQDIRAESGRLLFCSQIDYLIGYIFGKARLAPAHGGTGNG